MQCGPVQYCVFVIFYLQNVATSQNPGCNSRHAGLSSDHPGCNKKHQAKRQSCRIVRTCLLLSREEYFFLLDGFLACLFCVGGSSFYSSFLSSRHIQGFHFCQKATVTCTFKILRTSFMHVFFHLFQFDPKKSLLCNYF